MGISKNQAFFDPASPADGDIHGSYLIGADGTILGNTGDALKVTGTFDVDGSTVALDAATLAALENTTVSATDLDIRNLTFAADKVDASGSEVSLDAASLAALENITVSVDNVDFDIRNLVFATDKVDATGSEVSLNAATLAALESITVSATDLDIRDLSHTGDSIRIGDGTDFLAVNVDGSINTKQAIPATIKNSQQTATTTAAQLIATPLANRTQIIIQNVGGKDLYIGSTNGVTMSNGVVIPSGASAEFPWGPGIVPYAITASSSTDVRVLETA